MKCNKGKIERKYAASKQRRERLSYQVIKHIYKHFKLNKFMWKKMNVTGNYGIKTHDAK